MIKKEKNIALRLDGKTYQMIKMLADKYDRSVNSEINILLKACVSKWNVKTIKVHELPNEIKLVQEELTPEEIEAKEFDKLSEEEKERIWNEKINSI